jgi:hypothetical protein
MLVLEQIMNNVERVDNSSNTWKYKGNNYFYEIGREQDDGSITGSVYSMKGNARDSFKINSSGIIERFPMVNLESKRLAEEAGQKIYKERYQTIFE